MLTGKRVAAAAATATFTLLPMAGPAWADGGGADCPPGSLTCDVYASGGGSPKQASHPAQSNSHSSGGGSVTCVMGGQTVPCESNGAWFNASDQCYWKQEASPDPNDPAWNGHKQGDGALYDVYCPNLPGLNRQLAGGTTWAATPPPGYGGGGPNPAQLAQQALKKLPLLPPQIDINPKPGGKGLVGMPVWMAVARTAGGWGPQSASASAGGVTVTATGTVQQVVWSMGDGQSVTCNGPGTPYNASYGKSSSPNCGYTYSQDSSAQPGGKFTVTATATWDVHWVGGGQQGDLTTSRTSTVQITITQLQVVN
jgi:hypothetical protein